MQYAAKNAVSTRRSGEGVPDAQSCTLDMDNSGQGWKGREVTKQWLIPCKVYRGRGLWDGHQEFPHSEINRIMKQYFKGSGKSTIHLTE